MPRPMALCALFCETWDGASWPYTRARLYGMDKVRNRVVRICEFAVVFPFTLPDFGLWVWNYGWRQERRGCLSCIGV